MYRMHALWMWWYVNLYLRNMYYTLRTIHAAVLDFCKAFDVVPHHHLLAKLDENKINPVVIEG